MTTLFKDGAFTSHSGKVLPFKIDCDALNGEDLFCLAEYASTHLIAPFRRVIGVPRGGLRFASILENFIDRHVSNELIVDDVFTTGKSMEHERNGYCWYSGLVIFARAPTPAWITPIFTLSGSVRA